MESFETILQRMKDVYRERSRHDADDVSDTGLRLRVMAGELTRLMAEVEWLRRQSFPQTATGQWLDAHGEARGVARKEAQKATGTLRFTRYIPISFDIVVPAGTVCCTSGSSPLEYETIRDGVLAAGEVNVEIPARALLGGAEGNVSSGKVNTMVSAPTGVNYVTNPTAFSGGRGAEDDEEYRARVLSAYSYMANGSNAAYYRDIAMGYPGVGSAGAVPKINGANTVGVYIWGEGSAPESGVVGGLQKELDRLREVGVTVTVQAATAQTVNVTCRIKLKDGGDFDSASAAVKAAVAAYFAGLSVGSPVYLTDLEKLALNAAPIAKLEFPSTMRDVSASESVIPVLGTVTVEVIP